MKPALLVTWRRLLFLLALAAWALSGPARAAGNRFALVVGNNRGGERESSLRFAEQDASRFARLLTDLGGFEPERVVLLQGATAAQFREAFTSIDQEIRAMLPVTAQRALLLVFFSGHSDGINLEFGQETLPFAELRSLLEGSSAKIKIAFVDSCQSGSLTRAKGGVSGPDFDLVLTDTLEANGTAIVTSSAAGEKSQESGELQGSFFTNALLSGLRGAADLDQDRRVTLAELYQYAYDKTVQETARTLSGTQHPTYEFQIAGRGEVVLTDLARSQAALLVRPDTAGEFLVVRRDNAEVAAEFEKPFGTWRRLSLPAGTYRVAMRRGAALFAGEVTIPERGDVVLDPSRLSGEESPAASPKMSLSARSPFGLFLHYGLLSGTLKNFAAVHECALGMRLDLGPTTLFPWLAYGQASIDEAPLHYRIQLFSGGSYLTWRFEYNVLDLFAGILLEFSYGAQRLTNDQTYSGTMFTYGGVGGIDVPLYRGLSLQVFWEVGGSVFSLNDALSQRLALKGVLGVGYQF